MSNYEVDEADLLEQETPILASEEDPDEEYPNEREVEDDQEPDLEVGEPEDPGLTEG